MQNKTISKILNNDSFIEFVRENFMKPVDDNDFPQNFQRKHASRDFLNKLDSKEAKRIIDRELIRDNIYLKYKFDIFEYPFIVFYEDTKSKKLKPYKKEGNATNFCNSLLEKEIYSMLILIMNYEIECKIFKN